MDRLDSIEERLKKIEAVVFGNSNSHQELKKKKVVSLAELARRDSLKQVNGQQKIAIIVGYYELVLREAPVKPEVLRNAWKEGKFKGSYHPSFVQRAVGYLIRNQKGAYDLTQDGEDYFNQVINAG